VRVWGWGKDTNSTEKPFREKNTWKKWQTSSTGSNPQANRDCVDLLICWCFDLLMCWRVDVLCWYVDDIVLMMY
jgi:hypothetical protein